MTIWYILYSFVQIFRFWYHVPRNIWQPWLRIFLFTVVTMANCSSSSGELFFDRKKLFLSQFFWWIKNKYSSFVHDFRPRVNVMIFYFRRLLSIFGANNWRFFLENLSRDSFLLPKFWVQIANIFAHFWAIYHNIVPILCLETSTTRSLFFSHFKLVRAADIICRWSSFYRVCM
jgi:hypothetical protein